MRSHRFSKELQLLQVERGAAPLKNGSRGQGVAMVQIVLRYLGYEMPRSFKNRKPDGDFGPETEHAVKRFQQEHRLVSDGIIGKLTMAKLDGLLVEQPYLDSACPIAYRAMLRGRSGGPPKSRLVFYT
jgi:peptidoglycan hydrolase-like protein with peptidoglycan-binding domain